MYKYKIIATIVEIRGDGVCSYGHKVGDSFEFSAISPAGLCQFAYDSLRSAVAALLYGGQFPWADNSDVTTWACPDPERPVIFELRRVPV
ncbi:TIGR04076 family protein [Pelotomaculum isophthalicicum JI]|uniref:TIGR04076 family protein n=1 Tax=Pelotomaculum isophthalicicum JI TaxID=947010 RepID=A0A9X4H050_9FIRM|nr:TIGR04076 family protein [Pelotomaculum isophthalicicum]MDF9406915.1 TIGR04076 family protein [Pelotomaculum isophthalicicum JI]